MLRNQHGFTLLEWLISLSIGLLLLNFTSKLYINLYQTSTQLEATSEIQQNAQIAFRFLARDIRMSGFTGCANFKDITISKSPYLFTNNLMGWDPRCARDQLPTAIQKLAHTKDILYLQYADPERQSIVEAKDNTIRFANTHSFKPKEVLLLSDCKHAEILQLENVQLKHTYEDDAMLSHFYRIAYYVAPTHRKTRRGEMIYALYRKDLNTPEQPNEIVENVEKLEFRYGILDTHTSLQYVKAHEVKDWSKVRNVTVILHLTSTDYATQMHLSKPQRLRSKQEQTIMIRSCLVG